MKDFFEFLQALWYLVKVAFWVAVGIGGIIAVGSLATLGAEKGGL